MTQILRIMRAIHRLLLRTNPIHSLVVDQFHIMFYTSNAWEMVSWLGVPTWKCPFDLWIYQEIMYELRPDIVIESGTAFGGSALYLASLCDLLGHGRVLTIDIEPRPGRPAHARIDYLLGSSTDPQIVATVRERLNGAQRVLVILDSDHHRDHVLAELRAYAPVVSVGSYLILEDTNIGHPVPNPMGPGPMEAAIAFLHETDAFEIDRRREKLELTFNPRGYLRRVR